jgi:uncharacterized protein YbbC (DUF1343 family)
MPNWNRRLLYDETGLPWVNPSPNIRSVREAALYPGVGLLEVLPVSVGRGTDTPFEVVGAPFIDPEALADEMSSRRLESVTFDPTRFTPTASVHRGILCGGVQIHLWERRRFHPCELGIHLADALARLYPAQFTPEVLSALRTMVGNETIPTALAAGHKPQDITATWKTDATTWHDRRAPYLLYK